jgi:hypothetical protein
MQINLTISPPPSSSSSAAISSIRSAEANAENPAFGFFAKKSSSSDPPPLGAERLGGTVSPALSLAKSEIEEQDSCRTYQKSSSPFLAFFPLFLGGIVVDADSVR